jgi:hypothetical protein
MDAMTSRRPTALIATLLGCVTAVVAQTPTAVIAQTPAAVIAQAPAAVIAQAPAAVIAQAPLAASATAVTAGLAGPGQPICRITDERLVELSGLVVTGSGYVVINDGSDESDRRKIFYLDDRCAVVRTVAYPSRPRDTEDLALAADGTLWVADIGDNGESRKTIGLWRLAPGGRKPKLFRLTYPDGPHNAEALLLTRTGTPIVVTKSASAASLYVPAAQLDADRKTPLRRVGDVSVPVTGTSNPFGLPGRLVITGGAVSPDGRHVTLRTYADAFEYDVTNDDVIGAVTRGTPRSIPLPDEPQGEAVAYSTDGSALLTVSEADDNSPVGMFRYPLPDRPATAASPPPIATSTAPPATSTAPPATSAAAPHPVAADRAGIPTGALATAAALIVAAAALVVIAVRRRRRRGNN